MGTPRYHWKRRAVQIATIALIAIIPASGLFRIDLTTASFMVFNHQLRWSNIFFVFGLGLMIATAPIITYMTIGTVWCGWSCPQNTVSELANNLTHRLLGKRASVDIDSGGLKVAAAKNKAVNWLTLAFAMLVFSLLLAIIPFFYFYSPSEVWSFVTLGAASKISAFMRQLYIVTAVLVFIDIAVVRYFWCDYICLYRIGQRIFRTKDAVHLKYDKERSSECAKCNFSAATCIPVLIRGPSRLMIAALTVVNASTRAINSMKERDARACCTSGSVTRSTREVWQGIWRCRRHASTGGWPEFSY
jgi:polyferredoxin